MSDDFLFLGVSTRNSAVVNVFGDWCRILGVNWNLRTIDLPVGASADDYDHVLDRYAADGVVGGLVTSHKAALFQKCSYRFAELESAASVLGEVGLIRTRAGALAGAVSDVDASGAAFMLMREATHSTSARAVILGAGGAGLAFAYRCAMDPSMGIEQVHLVESDPSRRAVVADLIDGFLDTAQRERRVSFSLTMHASEEAARTLAGLDRYVLVNATGVGKDLPGDPLDSAASLASCEAFWEFNYRGDLALMDRVRRELPDTKVADGWDYFACGWSVVMSRVAGIPWSPATREAFSAAALERVSR